MGIDRCLLDILELPLVWMNLTGFYLRAIDRELNDQTQNLSTEQRP